MLRFIASIAGVARLIASIAGVARLAILSSLLLACHAPDGTETTSTAQEVRNGTVTDERPEVGTIGGCTATLVAQDVAITAAHCKGYGTRTNIGNHGELRLSNGGETRRYRINRYRSFSRELGPRDICVLGLAEEVPVDFARAAPLAAEVPDEGTPLTVYGFGCTRIGGRGDGQKRAASFEQGENSYTLCPGDSGGPVFNDDTGAVLRINSGYRLDRGNSDIFGVVPVIYDDVRQQVLDWAQGEVPEEGDPIDGLDPSIEVCGRNDIEIFEQWTCTNTRAFRYRCLPGGKPTWESCAGGCASAPKGQADTCAQTPDEACGDYAPYLEWACATDDKTLLRCAAGALESQLCPTGCEEREGDDSCL